jgi:chemotaxis family two-component system response regulator Rcp1
MKEPLVQAARPAVVLLAEDNPDHAFLTKEAFDDARLRVELHHVETGEDCLAFLRRQGAFANAPRPDLILLDIHMPRMDGYEVMEVINADESLRSLTVIILSTSNDAVDVERMYKLRCNSYMTKPIDFGEFAEQVRKLAGYWFELVVLPGKS